ncbi:MAG: transglutaminase-like domain-containing protein [Patescibacteria group bacterium]
MKYDPKKFNIRYSATLISNKKDNKIQIWIAKPENSLFQKINKFIISEKTKSSYKDFQGNKILFFEFKDQKNIAIQIDIGVTLWKSKFDLGQERIFLPDVSDQLFKRYTKSEKFLEQTQEIKKLAKEITKNSKNDLDKIKSIFIFIAKNFKYCYPVKKRGVKNLDLNKLSGDCGEYSSLFVTMCRISGIPARNNTGFVIFPKQRKISEHGWASIYLKPYGWVDIDPQYASLEKNINIGLRKYFGQRTDYRITLINGFNIQLKPAIPMVNNSVQILQPLVFASKSKIKFKDTTFLTF